MSEMKSLGRQSLIYGAGVVIGKLASFIMLPIYTRFLTPADYGILELLSMTIDLIGTIAGIGLASGIFKFREQYSDPKDQDEIVSTAALGTAGLALATMLVGLLLSPGLNQLVFGADGNPAYFRLFFLIYLFQSLEAVPFLLLRAKDRSTLFVSLSVAKLLTMLSLNVLFVVYLRMEVFGILLSNLIATAAFSTFLSIHLFREVGVRFSVPKLKAMASFGYPLVFWFLGNFALVYSDRYFLNHFSGQHEVGVYSLAYKFAFLLTALALGPVQMVWEPRRFAVVKRPDAQAVFARMFLYLNLALGVGALLIVLFVKDFLTLMAHPDFLPAYKIAPILLAAQILFHWGTFSNIGLMVGDRTRVLGYVAAIGAGAALVLNLVLIPPLGMLGAALSTFGVYLLRFFLVYRASQRHFAMAHRWAELANLYGILVSAGIVRELYGTLPVRYAVPASCALFTLVLVAIYRYVLAADERTMVKVTIARGRALLTPRRAAQG